MVHKLKYKPAMLREQPTIKHMFGWTLYCTKPCFVMLCGTNILFFFPLFPSNLHSIFQLPTSSLHHKILILALSRDPQKKLHVVWRECKMSRCPDVSATTPHLASMRANSGVCQSVFAPSVFYHMAKHWRVFKWQYVLQHFICSRWVSSEMFSRWIMELFRSHESNFYFHCQIVGGGAWARSRLKVKLVHVFFSFSLDLVFWGMRAQVEQFGHNSMFNPFKMKFQHNYIGEKMNCSEVLILSNENRKFQY